MTALIIIINYDVRSLVPCLVRNDQINYHYYDHKAYLLKEPCTLAYRIVVATGAWAPLIIRDSVLYKQYI